MALIKNPDLFQKFDQYEFRFCMYLNNFCRRLPIRDFFRIVSRLGDGVFWYLLILSLPLFNGFDGWLQMLYIILVGAISVSLYKFLKAHLVRERPYISFGSIIAQTQPLDRYSFPSGHSMNAACLAILLASCEVMLLEVVSIFAVLVAMSRVILGMHYPSDVIIGLILGAGIAMTGLAVLPFPVSA
jgi:undecaprenyl-diphosphatase